MSRETHVQFCERAGVRLPRATHHVVICQRREDAEALLGLVTERFRNYGLEIHPDKTRIVDFRHPWRSADKPQTFDFLGFTHYWDKTRRGGYAVARKTKSGKFSAALSRIGAWCKEHRHEPMAQQHRELSAKVRGHYAYYGIRGNSRCLRNFRYEAERLWYYWLNRRSSERNGGVRLWKLLREHFPLPMARIVQSATGQQQIWSCPP